MLPTFLLIIKIDLDRYKALKLEFVNVLIKMCREI